MLKLTRRRVVLGAVVGLAGLSLVPLVLTSVENRQAGETERLLPYGGEGNPSAQRTAVVFFSRSGSTALLARHLAKRMDGSLYRLDSSAYDLGLMGWVNAMRDALPSDRRAPWSIDHHAFRWQIASSRDNLSSGEAQALPSRQPCICKRMVRSRPA